jgi:hypothetical protein
MISKIKPIRQKSFLAKTIGKDQPVNNVANNCSLTQVFVEDELTKEKQKLCVVTSLS